MSITRSQIILAFLLFLFIVGNWEWDVTDRFGTEITRSRVDSSMTRAATAPARRR